MPSNTSDVSPVARRLALAALLLAGSLALAQESPRFAETIDVSLVNVEVIVTDRDGNRVRGLKAEDFTILEDRKPQTIVNFAEYSGAARAAEVTVEGPQAAVPARPPEPPPRQPRTFLIFVDEVALVFSKADFRPTITEVLDKALQPGDIGAVLSWTNRLNVRQSFTTDLASLKATIGKLPAPGPVPGDAGLFQQIGDDDAFWTSIALDPRNHGMQGEGPLGNLIRHSSATTSLVDMKSKVRALNAAMTAMAGAEGRKVLLLVTHRFSRSAGLEYFLGPREQFHPKKDPRYDQLRLVESVADTANATGFTIYGLYPEGIRASFESAETMYGPSVHSAPIGVRDHYIVMNETESLDLVADRTGGEYAIGTDVLKLLPRVTEDLTDYYSLAYRTSTRGTDNRRKISVRVKNRDHVVRARSEIVERSEETRMKDRVVAGVFATIDPGTIPLRAELVDGKQLKVEIPISALATVEKNGVHAGAFTVYIAWNAGGTVGESTRTKQPFTISPADLERAKRSHFTYTFEVRTDANTRALGVGVLDDTSKEYGVVTVAVQPRAGTPVRGAP